MRIGAFIFALLLGGNAFAATLEISAHDQGAIRQSNLFHIPGVRFDDDVAIGGTQRSGDFPTTSGEESHYQIFDLAHVQGTVESATFSIFLGDDSFDCNYSESAPPYTYPYTYIRTPCSSDLYIVNAFRHVDYILALRDQADGSGSVLLGPGFDVSEAAEYLYYGLVNGGAEGKTGAYGNAFINESDEGTWIDISLNATAIADINASMGGTFGITGQNEIPYCSGGYDIGGSCTSMMFDSPDSGYGRLTLTGAITVVPVPAAIWLFASALLGLSSALAW